jgi:hypothetical protein
MEAVRQRRARGAGVVGVSEDLIERYLAELRGRLRTSPAAAAEILAEAVDHLRESEAAGLAIGMTEQEAQEAAISAFGSVRAVARANRRLAPAVADTAMMFCGAVSSYLLTVFAVSMVVYVGVDATVSSDPARYPFARPQGYAGPPVLWAAAGAVGVALLAGYRIARHLRRRRAQHGIPGTVAPWAAAVSLLLAGLGGVTGMLSYQLPCAAPSAAAVGIGYLVHAVLRARRGQSAAC